MVSFERGNNKSIILGYDEIIVSPFSTQSCSYCLAANEVEALLAMCEYFRWVTRWESNSGSSLDIDLIRNFANDLDDKLMSPCCDDIPLSRFDENGIYQESTDGGDTYHNAPSTDPRNAIVGFPPIAGDDGEDKRCIASNSAVTYFKNSVALIQTAKDNEAKAADISAILLGILLVVGVIATAGWIFAFIGELIGLIYANVTALTWAAAYTEGTWQDLLCIFFCNMDDSGSFSTDQWQQVLGEIESSGFDPIAVDYFVQMMKGLGPTGLTNTAHSNLGGSLDCSACGCTDVCPDIEEFHLYNQGSTTFGDILDITDTYVEVKTTFYSGDGAWYLSIGTEDLDKCCYLTEIENVTDGGVDNFFQLWLGCEEGDTLSSLEPTGHFLNYIQLGYFGEYTIRLHFTSGP